MKRRLIAIMLMVCLLLSLLPTMALAATTTVASGYCGEDGTNLRWSLDSSGNLTISGTGRMKNGYISYEDGNMIIHRPGWDNVAQQIKSVSIGSFVTYIGRYAFNGCTSLQRVSLSSGLQEIGDIAFSRCTSLQRITLPDNLQIIGDSAFSNTGITNITIPASVTYVGVGAFAYCSSLKSINVSSRNSRWCSVDGVLFTKPMGTLWSYPIGNARTSYTVPDGVSSIMMQAFERSRLSSITLPVSLESISSDAFTGCYNLKSIVIPANVKTINNMAFDNCSGLSVYFRGNAPTVTAAGSNLRSFPTDTILYYITGTSGWSSGGTWNGYTLKKWEFTLGRDNNSFTNGNDVESSGFYGVRNFSISQDLYETLTSKLNGLAKTFIKVENFLLTNPENWEGSCFGISATMGLAHMGYLSLDGINTIGAKTYYGLAAPKDDARLLQCIQFYQLAQFINQTSLSLPHYNFSDLFSILDTEGIAVFSYGYKGSSIQKSYGHAILATGYRKNADGSYIVYLYDCDSASYAKWGLSNKLIEMKVAKNSSSFSFTDSSGSYYWNKTGNGYEINVSSCSYVRIFKLSDLSRITTSSSTFSRARTFSYKASKEAVLYIPFNTSGTITSASGETLIYDTDGFSGTMDILDTDAYVNEENSEWILTVPYSESFTATYTSDTFGLTIGAEDQFLSVKGSGIKKAAFTLGEGITLNEGMTGTYDFTAFVGTDVEVDENENNLIELSGTANAETQITYDAAARQVSAVSAAPLQDTTAYSLIRTDVIPIPDLDAAEDVLTVSAEKPVTADEAYTQLLPAILAASQQEYPAFIDVTPADWFYEDVAFVSQAGLMTGTADRVFSPNAPVTRGMVMTILARREGIKTDRYSPWYAAGVEWAVANGISDGTNSEVEITREELATMLYRYAKNKGYDLPGGELTDYTDANKVSNYAVPAIQWAIASGVMNGNDGKLTPRNPATRAQLAAMLQRFFK